MKPEDFTKLYTEAQLKQAIRDALEEAAKVCDDKHDYWRYGEGEESNSGPRECADEIRKLKDACKGGVIHASDCAVHNMPAFENGACDCGAKEQL